METVTYWEIKGNFWNKELYSLEEATKLSEGLVDCTGCVDCINCVNCIRCSDCVDCTDCYVCVECVGCDICNQCNRCISSFALEFQQDQMLVG